MLFEIVFIGQRVNEKEEKDKEHKESVDGDEIKGRGVVVFGGVSGDQDEVSSQDKGSD